MERVWGPFDGYFVVTRVAPATGVPGFFIPHARLFRSPPQGYADPGAVSEFALGEKVANEERAHWLAFSRAMRGSRLQRSPTDAAQQHSAEVHNGNGHGPRFCETAEYDGWKIEVAAGFDVTQDNFVGHVYVLPPGGERRKVETLRTNRISEIFEAGFSIAVLVIDATSH